jgi:hypothetical protein
VPYLATRCPTTPTFCTNIYPRSQFVFVRRRHCKVLTDNKTNLLNASVRVVHHENNSPDYR